MIDGVLESVEIDSDRSALVDWLTTSAVFEDVIELLVDASADRARDELVNSLIEVHPAVMRTPRQWQAEAEAIVAGVVVALLADDDPDFRLDLQQLRYQGRLFDRMCELGAQLDSANTGVSDLRTRTNELTELVRELHAQLVVRSDPMQPPMTQPLRPADWARLTHGLVGGLRAARDSAANARLSLKKGGRQTPDLVRQLEVVDVYIGESIEQLKRIALVPDEMAADHAVSLRPIVATCVQDVRRLAAVRDWAGTIEVDFPSFRDVETVVPAELVSLATRAVLDNALRHNAGSDDEVTVSVAAIAGARIASLTVADDGRGVIEPESLFQPGGVSPESSRRDPTSMGWSLHLCREALIRAGGSIDYLTDSHQGAVFAVSLPC